MTRTDTCSVVPRIKTGWNNWGWFVGLVGCWLESAYLRTWCLSCDLKVKKEPSRTKSRSRVLEAEGTASAKDPRWESEAQKKGSVVRVGRDGRYIWYIWWGRQGQNVKGFVYQDKDFMLYSKCNMEPLNGVSRRTWFDLSFWDISLTAEWRLIVRRPEGRRAAWWGYCSSSDERWWCRLEE